ncbi:Cytochrome P450 [Rhynchospora pubera]|uniref:Cytochrome P450 n=1 Tax=Rhynchospora pubera TaxID=906938 RepID=A0AAV8GQQ2_9POAL|nr:Cytochrome P450 [Rhynchospora pubera]
MHEILSQIGSNPWSLFIGAFTLLLLWGATRALEWAWLKPRRFEQAMRKQGLCGTVYRSLAGDLKEIIRLNKEARAKPMQVSHDISPRISPFQYRTIKQFGKLSFTWFGPYPRITVMDSGLVREILSNKFGHFEKEKFSRLGQLLAAGLANYGGEKWAKHRRILNPAFQVEKLKEMSFRRQHLAVATMKGDVFSSSKLSKLNVLPRQFRPYSSLSIGTYQLKIIKMMKQTAREVQTLLMGILAKRENAIRNGETTEDDLLGLLLESNKSEMEQNGTSDSSLGLTIDEVIEECKLFYFAGQETTSVLLTWTLVVLSIHPEWQEKAREEVLQHFGRDKPDFDGLSRLKIVSMILYEVLRLYPPVVALSRRTYKTTQLGDVTVPPGVHLHLPILFIHHDPDIWGPDATEFKPTRFAEGISKATKNGQSAFFPFGWGPRICIGQNFALLEAKLGLSMILQHFRFELSENYQHAPQIVIFTVHPQHGAPIKFHRL